MAEPVTRSACDRCHGQKLSCRRGNKDEPCERCLRLKAECTSSPSLRFRKQQQLQQQQQQQEQQQQQQQQQEQQQEQQQQQHHHHHQRQQLPVSEASPSDYRSPKRRRTDSDPSLVTPDAVPCPGGGLTSESHLAVTPDPVLGIGDFNFTFDQLGLFAAGQAEYLSHPELPGGGGHSLSHHPHQQHQQHHHHHQPPPLSHPLPPPPLPPPPPDPGAFADSWDPSAAYPPVAPDAHLPPTDGPPPVAPPGPLLRRATGCVPAYDSPDKRVRPRPKQRARQIHLADSGCPDAAPLGLISDAPSIPWMAHLSDLNARLLDLSSALPAPHDTARNGPSLGRPTDERFKSSGFPIDEMFKLTRRVADILEQSPSDESDAIDSSDLGNSMFILSTYMRLLDMYQKVFGLIQSELSQTYSSAQFRFWKLPDVTVGSFAVESSPFLQMSLTIQVAEEFLSRLRNSTARWSAAGAGSASMFAGVVDISFQAFRDREAALAKHLVELRCDIETLLDS
ncbi:hypothetical protein QQZ08_004405 [Neonectria magnoliae]|uniref:Zn(2)-C6 fungal-type domain-containing protein n=1 Tax=Neonectria magnoliae TaxID=2732573 RepID=A0ABR1I5Z3_9HYPO